VIYGQKYLTAIPLLRLLALAAGVNLLFGPLQNFLQSQGRFSVLFKWTGFLVTIFVAAVFIGAWKGGALWVAWSVLAMAVIFQPVGMWLATRGRGGSWRQVGAVYLPAAFASALALLPLELLLRLVPWFSSHWWAAAAVGTATFPPTYAALLWLFRRDDLSEIRRNIGRLRARSRPGGPATRADPR
jgi:O-antigen/teichoic acid export membrane protein